MESHFAKFNAHQNYPAAKGRPGYQTPWHTHIATSTSPVFGKCYRFPAVRLIFIFPTEFLLFLPSKFNIKVRQIGSG